MSDETTTPAPASNGLAGFVLENRSWMHFASLLMIVYAVWAVIEVLSNTWFHDLQSLTIFETGSATNTDSTDLQRNNSGMIIASGAVLGLFGLFAQYVYRGAPMVDSSMAAAAAMILDQATADRVSEEDIISKAEEAATEAAAEVAKETAEEPVIEMLEPEAEEEAEDADEEADEAEEAEEAEEESTEEEAEEEAEPEEEEEEAPPEEKKKF